MTQGTRAGCHQQGLRHVIDQAPNEHSIFAPPGPDPCHGFGPLSGPWSSSSWSCCWSWSFPFLVLTLFLVKRVLSWSFPCQVLILVLGPWSWLWVLGPGPGSWSWVLVPGSGPLSGLCSWAPWAPQLCPNHALVGARRSAGAKM